MRTGSATVWAMGLVIGALALGPPLRPAVGQHGAPERFVPGFDALPLMPGLEPVPETALRFDKPEGRIIQALARGDLTSGIVRAFYARTLPQLGWRRTGPGRFVRDTERLVLEFFEVRPVAGAEPGVVTVRFTLSPG